jgi:hypothetical protein
MRRRKLHRRKGCSRREGVKNVIGCALLVDVEDVASKDTQDTTENTGKSAREDETVSEDW